MKRIGAREGLRVRPLPTVIQAAPPPHDVLLQPFLALLHIFMLLTGASLLFPGLSLTFQSLRDSHFLEPL